MATIRGLLKKANGDPLSTVVYFRSLSTPVALDTSLISNSVVCASSDSTGAILECELVAGDYQVRWMNGRIETVLTIAVPAGDDAYRLPDLVVSSAQTVQRFRYIDFRTPDLSFARVRANLNGELEISDGDGLGTAVDFIDFTQGSSYVRWQYDDSNQESIIAGDGSGPIYASLALYKGNTNGIVYVQSNGAGSVAIVIP